VHFNQFAGFVICFGTAGVLFFNAYYAYRFPEKYMKANWTVRRGLPPEPESAMIGGTIALGVGLGFFAGGCLGLYGLLST
jgi:hypothetical protein